MTDDIDHLLSDRAMRKKIFARLFASHCRPGAVIRVPAGDHTVYVDPLDRTIAFKILTKGHWNRDELERAIAVLRAHGALRADGWFVDVGANIGTQSLYALLSGAFTSAIAIEPHPANADLLRRNARVNEFSDRLHIFEGAASDSDGTARLRPHTSNSGGHRLVGDAGARCGEDLEIRCERVDEIVDQLGAGVDRVGLLWLDVEGHEPCVTKGARRLLNAGVPLVFEHLAEHQESPEWIDMWTGLRARYTSIYCLQDERLTVRALRDHVPPARDADFLVFNPVGEGRSR